MKKQSKNKNLKGNVKVNLYNKSIQATKSTTTGIIESYGNIDYLVSYNDWHFTWDK